MTMIFHQRLIDRAVAARVIVTPAEVAQLDAYFGLLTRWNARMNLTALPLEGTPDRTLDRLFIEPLAAARYVPAAPLAWIDVGSGGGSPAIPLKIVRKQARLTMVESKARKAAFLREAARTLELTATDVQNLRFEELSGGAGTHPIGADLITIRAVAVDGALLQRCRRLLRAGGELLLFKADGDGAEGALPSGFKRMRTVQLTEAPAYLEVLKAV
jgi:16S rRNA (guanine527-N7)-methyltransferase